MPKLIFIQIPVFNEANVITHVLNEIPQTMKGFDTLKILVINDGSTDNTVDIVRYNRAAHVLDFQENQGLGVAFRRGLAYGLAHGADVIVNTDGDNQYPSEQIKKIVAPILSLQADVVIGDRQLSGIAGYPRVKLISQSLGNLFLSSLFIYPVRDSTSGFRAFSKKAAEFLAQRLENEYTYTIESLCLLLKEKMRVVFVPIGIRYPTRPSRLIKNKVKYIYNFVITALKIRFFVKNS